MRVWKRLSGGLENCGKSNAGLLKLFWGHCQSDQSEKSLSIVI